jgi:hypothetical protein
VENTRRKKTDNNQKAAEEAWMYFCGLVGDEKEKIVSTYL